MTIRQLPKPCFTLDPSPWDDDQGIPHYDTAAEAEAALAKVHVKRLDTPCWVAECDAPHGMEGTCGNTLGDEDEGPSCIHFETADEVIAWMPGESWTRDGADGALCWTHSPQDAAPSLPTPAEPEAAGQLRLPGVA